MKQRWCVSPTGRESCLGGNDNSTSADNSGTT